MLLLKLCYVVCFQSDRANENGGPGDPVSQNASVAISSKFYIQNIVKALAEMVQPHRLLQPGLQLSLALFYCTKTGQQMTQGTYLGLDHYPKFPRVS